MKIQTQHWKDRVIKHIKIEKDIYLPKEQIM